MRIPYLLLLGFGVFLGSLAVAQENSTPDQQPSAAQPSGSDSQSTSPGSIRTISGDRVYRVGNGVSAPKLIKDVDPEYTRAATQAGIQGRVVLWLVINAEGLPEQIRVQKSLDPGLDSKAVEAVSQWKFRPSLKDGSPVAVMINVEVNFKMR
jgi:protein TonB